MTYVFEALAPRGPIKGPNDKWDVFLSYRSVNRPWVLRLYDQLRYLGYKVFVDQFVLTTAEGLEDRLRQNLQRSATGVLIWSERGEDSVYCGKELNALSTLEQRKANFSLRCPANERGRVTALRGGEALD
jgi:hypothetical protein